MLHKIIKYLLFLNLDKLDKLDIFIISYTLIVLLGLYNPFSNKEHFLTYLFFDLSIPLLIMVGLIHSKNKYK